MWRLKMHVNNSVMCYFMVTYCQPSTTRE